MILNNFLTIFLEKFFFLKNKSYKIKKIKNNHLKIYIKMINKIRK